MAISGDSAAWCALAVAEGSPAIFVTRPIAATILAIALVVASVSATAQFEYTGRYRGRRSGG